MSAAEAKKEKQKEKKKARISSLYTYDYSKGKVELKNKKCPRCGNIMAYHKISVPRWTCGSCSFTDYVKEKEKAR